MWSKKLKMLSTQLLNAPLLIKIKLMNYKNTLPKDSNSEYLNYFDKLILLAKCNNVFLQINLNKLYQFHNKNQFSVKTLSNGKEMKTIKNSQDFSELKIEFLRRKNCLISKGQFIISSENFSLAGKSKKNIDNM